MGTAIRTLAALALLASGCVWNDQCASGAVRDEASGRCRVTQADAGRDAASPDTGVDAGAEDAAAEDGGTDAATEDGGTDAATPRTIEDFAVGATHACVVDSAGGLTCWGSNLFGQLATGDVAPQAVPRRVDLGEPVRAITGKGLHTCAETTMPSLFCWGGNTAGQIGNGVASADPVADPHALALGAARHVAGSIANTCFVDAFGEGRCWGRNDHGQLAIGMVSAEVPEPGAARVQTSAGRLDDISRIALGDRHALFLLTDGTLLCAGRNADGECGTTAGGSTAFATEVPGMTGVTSAAAGSGHSCAVQAGDVYCWGANEAGQAVPGAGPASVLSPTAVAGLGPVEQVVAGNGHSCALLTSGQVACWGSRMHGALGDGLPVDGSSVTAPVMVGSLSDVERIDASLDSLVCALTRAAELYCWGNDTIEFLGGLSGDARSVFQDEQTVHTAPVRVDPFAG